MGYGRIMGFGSKIPANRVGGRDFLWVMAGYGLLVRLYMNYVIIDQASSSFELSSLASHSSLSSPTSKC